MNNQKTLLEYSHFPVMLSEIIHFSSPAKGGIFVDCTFGGGNYSQALLKFPKTKVIGIDRDSTVSPIADKLIKKYRTSGKLFDIGLVTRGGGGAWQALQTKRRNLGWPINGT